MFVLNSKKRKKEKKPIKLGVVKEIKLKDIEIERELEQKKKVKVAQTRRW